MHTGIGQVAELVLRDGLRYARLVCQPALIPAPGQYLLAGSDLNAPLSEPVYYTDSMPEGFLAAPAPVTWKAGMELSLRGPLGRGFVLPVTARRVLLVPLAGATSRLQPLIPLALKQDAAVVLASDRVEEYLPDAVEVQPRSALGELLSWADWIAFDMERVEMPGLRTLLGDVDQFPALREASVFVRTPVPCGGAGDCGACAVVTKSGWKMACKDGPVFRWGNI